MKTLSKLLPVFITLIALTLTSCDRNISEEVRDLRDNTADGYDSAKKTADNTIDGAKDAVKKGAEVVRDANEEIKNY